MPPCTSPTQISRVLLLAAGRFFLASGLLFFTLELVSLYEMSMITVSSIGRSIPHQSYVMVLPLDGSSSSIFYLLCHLWTLNCHQRQWWRCGLLNLYLFERGDYIFKGPNSNWTYRGQLEAPSPNGTRDQMEFM